MIIDHMYYSCALSMPLPFFVFLWGMLSIPRPTKRFWIAVITYVELSIVVKYIFQFQFPKDANFNECDYYKTSEQNSPLCPPRIIGIERNQYSVVCDLLLLLGLFFHRFALKVELFCLELAIPPNFYLLNVEILEKGVKYVES